MKSKNKRRKYFKRLFQTYFHTKAIIQEQKRKGTNQSSCQELWQYMKAFDF